MLATLGILKPVIRIQYAAAVSEQFNNMLLLLWVHMRDDVSLGA